jgi:hypothetical protein
MIHHVTIYRKDTGEIVQYSSFSCEDGDYFHEADNINARLDFFGSETHGVLTEVSDKLSEYIVPSNDGPVIQSRPALRVVVNKTTLVANGTDSIVLSGLPIPCEMIQDPGEPEEERVTITGGGFIFTAENPGKYQFRIERFPFLPLDLEFTAT